VPAAAQRPSPVYDGPVTPHAPTARTLPERLAAFGTAAAAAVVVIAIAILPFLTPAWVAFEQGRTDAAALSGYSEADLRLATDSILRDLVLGPPAFAVEIGGAPVLEERERSHMGDVRGVFGAFAILAAVSAVGLLVLVAGARRMGHPERAWAAISTGMRWLIVGVVVAGIVSAVAFDALFELFHQLFFPGGTYTFDPRTDHLVQLFPFAFWMETTIALGVVIVLLAAVLSVVTGRRARVGRRAGAVPASIGRAASPSAAAGAERAG
jgi:integral membrane protein (TIGR01906 family)